MTQNDCGHLRRDGSSAPTIKRFPALLRIGGLFVLAFAGLTGGNTALAENWAEKMFANRSHDFRIVGRGAKAEYLFEFTNPYEEDVHVAAVRTSCGCTTPTLTQDLLSSHQKAGVKAKFNTSSFIGQKAATITVVFDRPSYAEVQLKVNGFIRTDITFDPPEVSFGELAAGQSQQREVVITHSGNSNWEIRDVRSHCENLSVRLSDAQRGNGTVRYRMQVILDGQMKEGDIRERLTLISNDRTFPTTEMAVSGRIRPQVSISPSSVSFGTLTTTGTAQKRLVVRGEKPFEIADVQCADERMSFEVPVGKKKVHFVKVHFEGDGTTTPISQEIRVETDLPGNKSATCILTGNVR